MTVKPDRVQRSRKKQEQRLGKHEISHHFKPMRQLPHPISGDATTAYPLPLLRQLSRKRLQKSSCQVMAPSEPVQQSFYVQHLFWLAV